MCVREAGQPGEAEAFLRQALEIEEVKLVADDMSVANMLYEMGRCVREAARPGEAEAWLKRALEIKEVKLGADHVDVTERQELGGCADDADEPAETA